MAINQTFRQHLEFYITNGLPIKTISLLLHVSRQTIYNELKYGLTEEEAEQKLWQNYKAETAQKKYERHIIDKSRK